MADPAHDHEPASSSAPGPSAVPDEAALRATAAEKLPHEEEHLAALERMAGLEPYYAWVLELAERMNGGRLGDRVLDAGCGIGNFVELLRRSSKEVLAVDLSPRNVAVLRRRFEDAPEVEVLQTDLDAEREALRAREVDAIVCLDVLEHLEDDRGLVRCFHDILPPGGTLFIKVPALQWLYGSVDEESDHHRRYGKRALRELIVGAGFELEHLRFMNLAGVGPYFLKSRVLRRRSTFSNSFTPSQLGWIRRSIGAFRALDAVTGVFGGPPVGQSLVAVARRPASPNG